MKVIEYMGISNYDISFDSISYQNKILFLYIAIDKYL